MYAELSRMVNKHSVVLNTVIFKCLTIDNWVYNIGSLVLPFDDYKHNVMSSDEDRNTEGRSDILSLFTFCS